MQILKRNHPNFLNKGKKKTRGGEEKVWPEDNSNKKAHSDKQMNFPQGQFAELP